MILCLGVDIVKVDRLNRWPDFSRKQLLKIFSEEELDYCFSNDNLTIQRMAVCFSVKESFFKALSSSLVKLNMTTTTFTFMFACNYVSFSKTTWGVPVLKIDWVSFEKKINHKLPNIMSEVSVAHEKDYTYSSVILYLENF